MNFYVYSNRLKYESQYDVYEYEKISEEARLNIVWSIDSLFRDLSWYFGDNRLLSVLYLWNKLYNQLLYQWGMRDSYLEQHSLYSDEELRLKNYISDCSTKIKHVLDFVEAAINIVVPQAVDDFNLGLKEPGFFNQYGNDIIDEINRLFRREEIGYQIENKQFIRIDHEHIHQEIVKPALQIIGENGGFNKVNEQYRAAHEYYRNEKAESCIVECNKAFETMLKAICKKYDWDFSGGAAAIQLISTIRKNGLFGSDHGISDKFIDMVQSVSTIRNNHGAHGSEPDKPPVPLYMAGYALHLTASTIVFLRDAMRDYEKRKGQDQG